MQRLSRLGLGLRLGLRNFSTSSIIRNATTFGEVANNNSTKSNNKKNSIKQVKDIVTIKNILHCNFKKNNTFLTLTRVEMDKNFQETNSKLSFNEQVLYYLSLPQKISISQSTGYLGFRKAQRGEYEASFQLSSNIFKIINDKKLIKNDKLEIVIKGFGKGRSAFFDALKGKEGNEIRKFITKLSDLTPISFGGNRAPSRRRI